MKISVSINDADLAGLKSLEQAMGDLSTPMRAIAEIMYSNTIDRYGRQVDPLGKKWLPTKTPKQAHERILYRGGALYTAIKSAFTATSAQVGVIASHGPERYARIHQFGGTIRPKNSKALKTPFGYRASVKVPARPYLGFEARDADAVTKIFTAFVKASLKP